jgi:hypothetical protein
LRRESLCDFSGRSDTVCRRARQGPLLLGTN